MIRKISLELQKRQVYHKVEKNLILTRRSKIRIPPISRDIFYLLGVISGDGSLNISKRKRGGYHYLLRIYSGEKAYLQYLNNLIWKLFNVKGRIIKDMRKDSSFHISIQSASMFFYFVILGSEIGKKKDGRLSNLIMENNQNLLNFIAGLVDTDGHIIGRRVQLKQKRLRLLEDIESVSKLLDLNCSEPKINYTNGVPFYYIRFDNKLPLRWKKQTF